MFIHTHKMSKENSQNSKQSLSVVPYIVPCMLIYISILFFLGEMMQMLLTGILAKQLTVWHFFIISINGYKNGY